MLGFFIQLFLKTQNCFSQVTYFVRQFLWKEHRFHFVQYCAVVENGNHFHDELVVVASLLWGALPSAFRHDWCDSCNAARGDQIEVFKILNGYENIDSNIFFEIKESKITRGHNYTLVKKQSRLDVRKYSFSQRTINVWNNLSTDCVQASSVNMFKNKIDKYLVKAGYT